jgi:hypothetical protein
MTQLVEHLPSKLKTLCLIVSTTKIRACTHACIYMHVHALLHTCAHTRLRAHTEMHVHTYVHVHGHTEHMCAKCTRVCANLLICMHVCTLHVHTCAQTCWCIPCAGVHA